MSPIDTALELKDRVGILIDYLKHNLAPEEVEQAISLCDRVVPAMQVIRSALLVNNGVSGEYNLAEGQIKCHKHEPMSA